MASSNLLKFVSIEREWPEKRPARERSRDHKEIYKDFARQKASRQASRCSQCGVPFCQDHCPLHNNIPDWLKAVAEDRLEEAYALASQTNSMPEICGRICPQDRLCEGYCVIEQSGHGTVTIGAIERYITETAFEKGWVKSPKPPASVPERTESVGIIGAGPAGLAAGERLRLMGFQVTIYDRHPRAGGLLTYGIPGFKLEKSVVARREKLLDEAGIRFVFDCDVGKDISFKDLRNGHAALLIATGVYNSRDLKAPGSGLANIVPALDYLIESNRIDLNEPRPRFESGELNAKGKRVVIIGGGDTAMDCVRTALRQGADSVKSLYRRDQANMPGSQREVANAIEEGGEFVWLSSPKAFLGESQVERIQAIRMLLSDEGAGGRLVPVPSENSDFYLEADLVIKALGFEPEPLPHIFAQEDLEVQDWGTLKVSYPSFETSLAGVFAAGDIVRGASLVVHAINEGRMVASAIADYVDRASRRLAAE